jgi:hypothetical protein
VAAVFLISVAGYYSPVTGFTYFLELPEASHARELPVLQQIPHDHHQSGGYDGQFYAQIALDPLLADPAIDRALDNAPYRARRILFAWTAYALGLGRPAWVLQAYAVQNVLAWIVFAWVLCRWFPPGTTRAFVLWTGCLFTHGLIASVRYALVDGPATLLLTAAVALAESNRVLSAAWLMGLAGLGRDAMLLGVGLFAGGLRARPRTWLIAAAAVVIAVVPLALWLDYLRSIYRSTLFLGDEPVAAPLAGLLWKLKTTRHAWSENGLTYATLTNVLTLTALATQAGCVIWGLTRSPRLLWAWAAAPFLLLALVMDWMAWQGSPGSFTRVLLPLALAANVVLASRSAPWWLIVAANLGVIPALIWWLFRV